MLLCCVVLVQLLVHGFVLSYGVLVARVTRRFRVSLVEAGHIFLLCYNISGYRIMTKLRHTIEY